MQICVETNEIIECACVICIHLNPGISWLVCFCVWRKPFHWSNGTEYILYRAKAKIKLQHDVFDTFIPLIYCILACRNLGDCVLCNFPHRRQKAPQNITSLLKLCPNIKRKKLELMLLIVWLIKSVAKRTTHRSEYVCACLHQLFKLIFAKMLRYKLNCILNWIGPTPGIPDTMVFETMNLCAGGKNDSFGNRLS